jgi:type II secretory pathway component PulK
MTRAGDREEGTQGMILLVVLWAVSLMTLTVVAISALSQKSLSLAGVETDRLRSELALEAGMAAAEAIITGEKPEARIFFDGTPKTLDLGIGRRAEISIRDTSGLIDLNRADPVLVEAFVKRNADDPMAAGMLIEALAKLRPEPKPEASDSAANANVQNRSQPAPQGQDEDSRAVPAPQGEATERPAARLFASIGQLYALEGISDEVLDKLVPLITLYGSQSGKINPLAAPTAVLLSIPGFDEKLLKVVETARKDRQLQGTAFQAAMLATEKYLAMGEARCFSITVKLVDGPGLIAGSRLSATLVLDDSGNEPFQAMAWSW